MAKLIAKLASGFGAVGALIAGVVLPKIVEGLPTSFAPILLVAAAICGIVWFWLSVVVASREKSGRVMGAPTMTFQKVGQYIAHQSNWAARFDPRLDDNWITEMDSTLTEALARGLVTARGFRRDLYHPQDIGRSDIPRDFWLRGNFDSHRLVLGEEPLTMAYTNQIDGGLRYIDIIFDRAEVEAAWPKRSLWAAVRRRSPAERTGALDLWFRRGTAKRSLIDQAIVSAVLKRLG